MKLLILALAVSLFTACSDKEDSTGVVTPPPPPPVEDKEKPLFVDAEGKKWGTIKEVSSTSLWALDSWHGERPDCPAGAELNKPCDPQGMQGCKKADGQKLMCKTDKAYKVYGWVYEKEGVTVKPLEGVKVDHFWFSGCMVGFCKPVAGPVETDKNGYFEYMTSDLKDQVRIVGKEGYFGLCQGTKPIQGGGTSQLGVGKPTLGGVQYKLKDDSCKNGVPQ